MSWPVGWQGNDAAVKTAAETIGEALRRLRLLCGRGHGREGKVLLQARGALLEWLEGAAATRGPDWRGLGEWAYVECHTKAAELFHTACL